MMAVLEKKNIVLAITGSIAAYKAVQLASALTQAGAVVQVVMTTAAHDFIGSISLKALTGHEVYTDVSALDAKGRIAHVELGIAADLVVVAPATANTIARLAGGMADDIVTATWLTAECPRLIAPAMESGMYRDEATQNNLQLLANRGVRIVAPETGCLASGRAGIGRMAAVEAIVDSMSLALGAEGELRGKRIVVTAGGTREHLDPVRFIGNPSSGRQGIALAEVARDRGAEVVLIAGVTSVRDPAGVRIVRVATAKEMLRAVETETQGCDALIMAAAVGDYRMTGSSKAKIKKTGKSLILELEETDEIVGSLSGDFVKLGFAAETESLVQNAQEKLHAKGLDAIVANDVSESNVGFDSPFNHVMIIRRTGKIEEVGPATKYCVAEKVMDVVAELLKPT